MTAAGIVGAAFAKLSAVGRTLSAAVFASGVAIALVALWAGGGGLGVKVARAEAVVLPAPDLDPSVIGAEQVAVLAGGCFWGVQAVFQHTDGVIGAVSGYSGGSKATAVYGIVGLGRSGHAEAVQVRFDPRKISYGRILQIFFSVAHDPTQLNRQGPDVGTQYRSAIFYADANQERVAKAYIKQLGEAGSFAAPIVTQIDKLTAFYPAEDYHQDYATRNPTHPYIVVNDRPKIDDLKRLLPALYRERPVLVGAKAG